MFLQLLFLVWQVTSLMDGYSLYCLGHARQHLHPSRSGPPPPLWIHRLQVCKTLPHSKSCYCMRGCRICAWNEEKRTRPGYSLPPSRRSDAMTPAEPALELGTQASETACLLRPLKWRTNQLVGTSTAELPGGDFYKQSKWDAIILWRHWTLLVKPNYTFKNLLFFFFLNFYFL